MGSAPGDIRLDRGSLAIHWPGWAEWTGLGIRCRMADGSVLVGRHWSRVDPGHYQVPVGPVQVSLAIEGEGGRFGMALSVSASEAVLITDVAITGALRLRGEPARWLLYDGYQSWDPAGYAPADLARRESWWTAAVADQAGAGVAAAGTTANRSSIRFELTDGEFAAIWCEPQSPVSSHPLGRAAPGAELALEAIAIAAGQSVTALLDELAGRHRPKPNVPQGWLSWYHFGPWVSKDHVLANSNRLIEGHWADLGHRLIQVDDGWQLAYGDWFENEKFQPGLAELAAELAARGQVTGVWTAPFLVAEGADLARDAPDNWFVKDSATGLRAVDPRHIAFGPMHVLDGGNPEVQEHLERTFTRLYEAGIRYFKIDFLYAGAYAGTAALRLGVEAIRRGVKDAYLLSCGAPLLPMVGLVDGCRIGADTATPIYDLATGLPKPAIFGDEVLAVARNVAARHFMEGWFHLDADVALVGGNLELEQGRQLVTIAALSGGPFFSSDDLDALPPDRVRLLDNPEVLALVGGAPAIPDWEPNLEDLPPSVWRRGAEVVAVFNWTSAPRDHVVAIPGKWSVRDLWQRSDQGTVRDSLEVTIPAHGVRLLELSSA